MVRADQLLVAGAASESGWTAFSAASEFNPSEDIESGDIITAWVSNSDSVGIV